MPRKTIKQLEQIVSDYSNDARHDREMIDRYEGLNSTQAKTIVRLEKELELAKRDVEWHKRLSSELASAVAGYMRSR